MEFQNSISRLDSVNGREIGGFWGLKWVIMDKKNLMTTLFMAHKLWVILCRFVRIYERTKVDSWN